MRARIQRQWKSDGSGQLQFFEFEQSRMHFDFPREPGRRSTHFHQQFQTQVPTETFF